MNRKLLIIALVVLLCGAILASIFIIKKNNEKEGISVKGNSTVNSTTNEYTLTTPTPEATFTPSPVPSPEAAEKDNGEVIFNKKVNLNEDNKDEEVKVIKVSNGNQQYEGVLKVSGENDTIKLPFVVRDENSMLGFFDSIDFVDLDNDSYKDIFITIPETGSEFNTSCFFAYSLKKHTEFSYDLNNMDFIENVIKGFKFSYSGNGSLNVENASYDFLTKVKIINSSYFSDSEEINKNQYDKAWIEIPPVEIDQNFKLGLMDLNGLTSIKIPLPVFGQSTLDILGEIDAYFIFDKGFKPVLSKFEVTEFNGNIKNSVGSKVIN